MIRRSVTATSVVPFSGSSPIRVAHFSGSSPTDLVPKARPRSRTLCPTALTTSSSSCWYGKPRQRGSHRPRGTIAGREGMARDPALWGGAREARSTSGTRTGSSPWPGRWAASPHSSPTHPSRTLQPSRRPWPGQPSPGLGRGCGTTVGRGAANLVCASGAGAGLFGHARSVAARPPGVGKSTTAGDLHGQAGTARSGARYCRAPGVRDPRPFAGCRPKSSGLRRHGG